MVSLDVPLNLLEIYVFILAIQTFENSSGDVRVVEVLQLSVKCVANSFADFAIKSIISHKKKIESTSLKSIASEV